MSELALVVLVFFNLLVSFHCSCVTSVELVTHMFRLHQKALLKISSECSGQSQSHQQTPRMWATYLFGPLTTNEHNRTFTTQQHPLAATTASQYSQTGANRSTTTPSSSYFQPDTKFHTCTGNSFT